MTSPVLIVSPDTGLVVSVLAPFAVAAAAPFLHRIFENWTGLLLALLPALIFVYLLSFAEPVIAGGSIVQSVDWVPALGLRLSFVVDGLSLVFALLISGIGTMILIYSGSYLSGYAHQGRFLGFMVGFMGAMLGLVLADNTIALYAFWELTTVTSFLLIGYDHMRQAARRAAIQALVVTGAGGLALLVAALLIGNISGSFELSTVRAAGGLQDAALYLPVLIAVLVAAFTKSAQFPLHFWLPGAMQAPTPVSAYLHSATMVQGGVYLLARMTPLLGGTSAWSVTLTLFGGATLLWGAMGALRQTDLKQMLAQSTIAALGMLVMLLGVGTEIAVAGAVVYFVAHALYKACLFLIAGVIESSTGARDITVLGGLRGRMAITFAVTLAAAVSMIGLPPAIGFLAKEETYAAVAGGDWQSLIVLVVMILGNALMAAIALAIAFKPFMGALLATPIEPREGSPALLLGPALFAVLGLAAGWMTLWFADSVMAPATSTILGAPFHHHVTGGINLASPLLLLSLATWVLGGIIFWRLAAIRGALRRLADGVGWTFEAGFDSAMFALIRFSAAVTRFLHHGRLEGYLALVFVLFAAALLMPMAVSGGWPGVPPVPALTFYEWGTIALALAGIVAVLLARTRLFAIVALGVQGLAVSLLYMLFGAPDLSFTQFMVEILSVVIFALVMTRLNLDNADPRPLEDFLRDGGVAVLCGAAIVVPLLKVLEQAFDPRLSTFFAQNSEAVAHGHNIVNVILVDFRGLDTLGEISVVMGAGIAILALIRRTTRPKPPAAPATTPGAPAPPRRPRKPKAAPEASGA